MWWWILGIFWAFGCIMALALCRAAGRYDQEVEALYLEDLKKDQ